LGHRTTASTTQVLVRNGNITLRTPRIEVDSVCTETITPQYVEALAPRDSQTYTVTFDCTGVAYGDYPVTYSLLIGNGVKIASRTYTLTISAAGVTVPGVVILAVSAPSLSPGSTSTAVVTIQNSGNVSTTGDVGLDVPTGWVVAPTSVPITLGPGEVQNVSFQVTSSSSAGVPTGMGVLTGFASFLGVDLPTSEKINVTVNYQTPAGLSTVTRAVEIGIIPRTPYTLIGIFGVVALGVGLYYYFFRIKRKRK